MAKTINFLNIARLYYRRVLWQLSTLLLLALMPLSACAWDSTGHRIIAAIAYDNLQPTAKAHVDQLSQILDKKYPPYSRFLYLSVLPDKWRNDRPETAAWHFYNAPWSPDGLPAQAAATPNLITALEEMIAEIKVSPNPKQQATDLAFIIHLLGDAHQPLHCINRISAKHPQGDRGGNLFPLRSRLADNLHAYWDKGASLLFKKAHYPFSNRHISKLAKQIEQQYPASTMLPHTQNDDVSHWMTECFELAKTTAYDISANDLPSQQYRDRTAEVVARQLALAGYRLAYIINHLFE